MKKVLLVIIMMVAVTVFAQRRVSEGVGKQVTATTTPQAAAVDSYGNYAEQCSVENTGSGEAFIQLGSATNEFVMTNAIPLSAGATYTFPAQTPRRFIRGIVYATTTNTTTLNVAFE